MGIAPSIGGRGSDPTSHSLRDHGGALNGTTDDSAALTALFTAMKAGGSHATGRLVIDGPCYLASGVVFDGGYTDVTNTADTQFSTARTERFEIVCEHGGSINAAAGIGTAVTVEGFYNPRVDLRFVGGGESTDAALLLQNIAGLDLDIYGQDFAGILCKADATGDTTKGLTQGHVRSVLAQNCGQAISWTKINGFGTIDLVWDNNSVSGSLFSLCADIDIGYYTNFAPATQTNGVHFDGCNNMGIRDLDIGDRATDALLRISSDSGGSDFGFIGNCRVSSNGTPAACVTLDEVKSITIDRLQTTATAKGLQILGGGQDGIVVKQHFSLSSDTNPLYVGSATNNTPKIDVGCYYRNIKAQAVVVATGLTGGILRLHGYIDTPNSLGAGSIYAIDSASSGITIDVSDLEQLHRTTLAGSINHSGTINRVRTSRLGNDTLPAVTGSRGSNAALASLLTTLATMGLLTDSTT